MLFGLIMSDLNADFYHCSLWMSIVCIELARFVKWYLFYFFIFISLFCNEYRLVLIAGFCELSLGFD